MQPESCAIVDGATIELSLLWEYQKERRAKMEFGLMQYSNTILFLIIILIVIYLLYLIIKALRKYTKSEPVRKQKAANAKNLGENNKLSTLALFLAGLVCGFLIFEWITPTSSLALLVSMIAVALVGIVLAVMGIKKQKSALSVISLVAASLSAGVIIILFGIMFIMGLGE